MADGVVQLVARLASNSGLPADTTENVFNCGLTGVLQAGDVQTAMDAVVDFYNALATGQGGPIAARISGTISRASDACSVLVYATLDLTGTTPFGSPVNQRTFTMGPETATNDLPEEVAIVISYNGDLTNAPVSQTNPNPPPATIRPQQRRRGRTYVGPLNNVAGLTAGDGFWRPTTAVLNDFGAAFKGLADEIATTNGLELGVWSKADAEVYTAIAGSVDNAWDTQRRRGVAATVRDPFTI